MNDRLPYSGPFDALTDGGIEASEERGKRGLLKTDLLPVEIQGRYLEADRRLQTDEEARADFEALGFVLGEPSPDDPLFAPATFPTGWTRDGSIDHSMWSHLLDEDGNRRVAIFYKAAFYDRRAFMRLETA